MMRKSLAGLALVWILILAFGGVAAAQETKTLYWQRYDVDLSVQKNGDVRITETQELVFTQGTFRYGQREIPLNRLSDITEIAVRELNGPDYRQATTDAPYTFRIIRESGWVKIRYNFPASSDTRRTIVIGYTVKESLRYYPDKGVDQLYWKAIPAGNPFPTKTSVITLHVPEPATFTNYGIYGAEATASFQPGQRDASIVIKGPIRAGQEVEVVAEWQHGIVAGQAQPWQKELDAEAAQKAAQEDLRRRWGPVADLAFLALSGLILIGGPVLLYLWWYNRGRDAPVGLIADYLPEPPADLPPGMAGTLLDESADLQDILATILDLARRGAIEIEEVKEPGFLGIGSRNDYIYRRKQSAISLRKYEQTLLEKMFGDRDEVRLSDLKNKFYQAIPILRRQLYQAVVDEGFFKRSPEATRTRYSVLGIIALIMAVCVGIVLVGALADFSAFVLCLPISLGVVAIGIIILARYMPQRTPAGADAVARWRAFKRYLQNLEKYTKVEEAADIFERYLPYAVAFGLERSWLQKFARVEAPPPTWWIPYGYPRPYYGSGPEPTTAGGRPAGPAREVIGEGGRPTLSDMSRGMGASLASMSAGLGAMLSSAASTLTSAPSSSGRGGFGGRWLLGRGRLLRRRGRRRRQQLRLMQTYHRRERGRLCQDRERSSASS